MIFSSHCACATEQKMPEPLTSSVDRKSQLVLRFRNLLLIVLLASFFLRGLETNRSLLVTMEPKLENYKTDGQPLSERYHNPIRQLSILGERNSGTRWTFDHLSDCFGHRLRVEKKLTRYKHWFQFDDPKRYDHDTLVITQFRNPYDWLKAMERVPHHAPNHMRTMEGADTSVQDSANDWRIFLTREWTMERIGMDVGLPANFTCQDEFLYRDIVSCHKEPLPHSHYNHTIRYSEHQPFYEMRNDGSGLPYANILELRSDKIRNFLSVRNFSGVADAWIIQYEYLINNGTQKLLKRIQEWTGVVPQCKALPPQVRQQKKTRYVDQDFAKHVRQHLNWTTEALIGYEIEWVREDWPVKW